MGDDVDQGLLVSSVSSVHSAKLARQATAHHSGSLLYLDLCG